ncbi:MAG: S8 family peptidase [Bacteroidia bacterium]|jgi:subtilisin family serine protease
MKNTFFFVLICSFVIPTSLSAQKAPPQNWFHLDKKANKYPGVSSDKVHQTLLKGKSGKQVVVAVIDGGTDVNHEDLKDIIWVNTKEIPGNGIDDDRNGYVDDINGWSFIGGKDSDVVEDTYEVTRMYAMLKPRFEKADTNSFNAATKKEYKLYQEVAKEFKAKYTQSSKSYEIMGAWGKMMESVKKESQSAEPTTDQVMAYIPKSPTETFAKETLVKLMKKGAKFSSLQKDLEGAREHYAKGTLYSYNMDFNPRTMIGDNYNDPNECCYGNNRVSGPKGEHGTHVAGIIAGIRDNGKGMNGVASNVRIMVLRVVPDGDERDKDVANAIRYAADNGASIINMSFGKAYSPYKDAVDQAVRYAEQKDVLIVHAAGNDNKDTDNENNYPRDRFTDNGQYASNWIEVGASSWEKKKKLRAAPFSNYGKVNVDVFAPGVAIYSTLPENTYGSYNGTSMAAPVTAGVAAIIRSYYPSLSAAQVKTLLMQSVDPVKSKVVLPGSKKTKVKMTDLCISGGVINAYNAVLLAEQQNGSRQ